MKKHARQKSYRIEKAGDGIEPSRAFSREYRLLNARQFSFVFADARRSSDRYFTVLGRRTTESTHVPRLGLAIAKKQLRRAVDRNRIKRLVREFFRTEQLYRSEVGIDYVVMARSVVLRTGNRRLRESLADHFKRIQAQLAPGNDTDQSVS